MKLMNNSILKKEESIFICVDLQEKLMKAMDDEEKLIKNSNILLQVAEIYNIPVLITEQYPKGLGNTDSRIILPNHHKLFVKDYFSVFGSEELVDEFNKLNRKNVFIFGIEAHVCVYYSVYHLIENGYNVYLIADAVDSRTKKNKKIGIEQMRKLGANIISTEMALFMHIENSKVENFKQLSNLIK